MRKAVRVIVIHEDKLLVMHRNKFGTEYDTLPGGNIEPGETPEQALEREVYLETSIRYKEPRLVFVEEAGDPYGTQYIYVADYQSGSPALREDSDEAYIHKMGKNLYEPMWVSINDLANRPFLSEHLKHAIIHCHHIGFPESPMQVSA